MRASGVTCTLAGVVITYPNGETMTFGNNMLAKELAVQPPGLDAVRHQAAKTAFESAIDAAAGGFASVAIDWDGPTVRTVTLRV